MTRFVLALTAFCLLAASLASAADYVINRKVLLPNNAPAAKLPVVMRIFDNGRPVSNILLHTDANGMLNYRITEATLAKIEYPFVYLYLGSAKSAFMISQIDSQTLKPSTAVDFFRPPMPAMLLPGAAQDPDPNSPIYLQPPYTQKGRVVDWKGQPVVGATVKIGAAQVGGPFGDITGGFPVNYPVLQISTPQLTAVTGVNGVFQMPGLSVELGPGMIADRSLCAVYAVKSADGKTVAGENPRFLMYAHSAGIEDRGETRWKIVVEPTRRVSGRVLDSITGRPMAGVRVGLLGRPDLLAGICLPVQTDANGSYTFPSVPRCRVMLAIADRQGDNYTDGWTELPTGRYSHRPDEAEPDTTPIEKADISVNPLVDVPIVLTDAETEAATGATVLMTIDCDNEFSEGTNPDSLVFKPATYQRVAPPEGKFTARIPVGSCTIAFTAPGYKGFIGADIQPENNPPVEAVVERQEGLLFQFQTNNPKKFENLKLVFVNEATGESRTCPGWQIRENGRWFFECAELGPIYAWQVQIIRNGKEIVPLTNVPNIGWWPIVLIIP